MNRSNEAKQNLDKEMVRSLFARYGVLIGIALLIIIFSLTTDSFFDFRNFSNVFKQASINGFIAIGLMLAIITGGIDLSAGSNLAVTSILCAQYLRAGIPTPQAIMLSLVGAMLFGLVNGVAIAYTAVPQFIVTLSMQTIGRGLALIITNGSPITVKNDFMLWLGRSNILEIPVSIWVLALVVAISWVIMNKTKIGRYIYAIGGNLETAKLSGINVPRYIMFTYSYAGLLYGIAAVILTGRLTSGAPTVGIGYELDAVAAAVLGGTAFTGGVGTVGGTILGAALIAILGNGMTLMNVSSYIQQVVRGGVIFNAVYISMLLSRKRTR